MLKIKRSISFSILLMALLATQSIAQSTSPVTGQTGGKKIENPSPAKTAPPLSSAKTIRELLDADDMMAVAKERKAAADESKLTVKEKVVEPGGTTGQDSIFGAKANVAMLAAVKREAQLQANTIVVTRVMGMRGERIISANIGGKPVNLSETGSAPVSGWKLVQIEGACATFEKAEPANDKPRPKSISSKASRGEGTELMIKRACFTGTTPTQQLANSNGQLSGIVPLPMPYPLQRSQAAQMQSNLR